MYYVEFQKMSTGYIEDTIPPQYMKYECVHADTCLPDYWGGHHLPHISVPVYKGMHLSELKTLLINELRQGAVAGNTDDALALSCDYLPSHISEEQADRITRAAYAAIKRIKPAKKGARRLFNDLDDQDNDADYSVYAYFVFVKDRE